MTAPSSRPWTGGHKAPALQPARIAADPGSEGRGDSRVESRWYRTWVREFQDDDNPDRTTLPSERCRRRVATSPPRGSKKGAGGGTIKSLGQLVGEGGSLGFS